MLYAAVMQGIDGELHVDWDVGPRVEDSGGYATPMPCSTIVGVAPAHMTMTVALKFDSPSSARGMLSFKGKSAQ
jgi:hypothetical protein